MRVPRWFYAVVALILEAVATRRDRQIRFLKAQIEILQGRLPGNRVIVDPEDRLHLLKLGQEMGTGQCRLLAGGIAALRRDRVRLLGRLRRSSNTALLRGNLR